MRKKLLCLLLATVAVSLYATGCSQPKSLPYYDSLDADRGYNRNLFYRNDLKTPAADPSVIGTEQDGKTVFYLYATSDEIGNAGFLCRKSYDLSHWDTVGVAFAPDRRSWANRNFRAPEVIELGGKYYMYYTAMDRYNNDIQSIGLAVSDNPETGFTQWVGTNADGVQIGLTSPLVDFRYMPESHPLYAENAELAGFLPGQIKAVDASPFIDDDGQMYLYFCRDSDSDTLKSEIWGMRMKDPFTPDYTSVTRLTQPNKATVGGADIDTEPDNAVNEAPFMYKADGKYYLTYSVGGNRENARAVAQAIGNTPLGEFGKVPRAENGLLLYAQPEWDHLSGAGHHCFVRTGDELFVVYQAYTDRVSDGKKPAIAVDRVTMRDIGGKKILHANGGTRSIQPLPASVTGYTNVALSASVTGVENAGILNDGIVPLHEFDGEEVGIKGTVTLKFDKPVAARAVLVYNSRDYGLSFDKVDAVELTDDRGKRFAVNNLGFDRDAYTSPEGDAMRPGGAAIAEFDEKQVREIRVTVHGSVGEIVVLGREV